MLKDLDIAIMGAGIAGLTCALALHKQGFKNLVVFEQAKGFSALGAGLQLGPNAVRELTRLGLGEHLHQVANSCAVGEMHLGEDSTHSFLGYLPLSEYSLKKYGQPCLQLLRSDLHQVTNDLLRFILTISRCTKHRWSSWQMDCIRI